ncbi:MAG: phosphorylase [Flavobacteriaceae bacterium]|nr:phosphorylase [Flavobacteriaceae bacterium]|tara:strand:+ start:7744 stop:8580 length:837 start_codon:yes stop_codon:yes gene_type:complete
MSSSEIITNNDNSIYHLHLKPNQLSKDIILVGDPYRVDSISKYFDNIEFVVQNREFKSVTGLYDNKRISIISTGIGGSNIDIVINEVDTLFNYDFNNRRYNSRHVTLNFIRIGTSGSISENVPVNSHLISEYAIDLNSQLSFYKLDNYKSDNLESIYFENHNLNCFSSSRILFEKFYSDTLLKGLTATCNGFYAFQGRKTRIPLENSINIEKLNRIVFKNQSVTNLEMETAIIYGLSDFLGHNAISLNAILANRVNDLYSKDPNEIIDSLIRYTLKKI